MVGTEAATARSLSAGLGISGRLTLHRGPLRLAVICLVAVTASELFGVAVDDNRIRLLNPGSSASWSHVIIKAVLVVASVVTAMGAWRPRERRYVWWLTAAIFVFLSIAEISPLHKYIDPLNGGKLLYAPILLALLLCLLRLPDRGDPRVGLRVALWAGLALLIISFAIHLVDSTRVFADTWAYQVEAPIKQATELAGWLLIFSVLCRLALAGDRRTPNSHTPPRTPHITSPAPKLIRRTST
jgi:hypothetical protein